MFMRGERERGRVEIIYIGLTVTKRWPESMGFPMWADVGKGQIGKYLL